MSRPEEFPHAALGRNFAAQRCGGLVPTASGVPSMDFVAVITALLRVVAAGTIALGGLLTMLTVVGVVLDLAGAADVGGQYVLLMWLVSVAALFAIGRLAVLALHWLTSTQGD